MASRTDFKYNREHDQYREQYIHEATRGECSAAATCKEQEGRCFGPVEVYRVRDDSMPGMDWGFFAYCDCASERDKQAGLTLITLSEWDALTQETKE